jgi:hypothetical protein
MIRQTAWPTGEQLARMGLVQCAGENDGERCTTWVEPVNTRQERHEVKWCMRHRPKPQRRNRPRPPRASGTPITELHISTMGNRDRR